MPPGQDVSAVLKLIHTATPDRHRQDRLVVSGVAVRISFYFPRLQRRGFTSLHLTSAAHDFVQALNCGLPFYDHLCTVFHKKGGTIFMVISLSNLNRFFENSFCGDSLVNLQ